MKRKFSIILSLVLVMAMATPVFAAVNLDVNGRAYQPSSELYLENGYTLAPLDVIINTLGCHAAIDGDQITLQENNQTLAMTVGNTAAVLNGDSKLMPMAPRVISGQTYVPLRFVFEALGASISWNGQTNTASITYNETRQGMTADELMAKASAKMIEAGRYKMLVDMQSAIDMTASETGQEAQNIKMDMDGNIEAWVQMDPVVMYMKQKTTIDAPAAPTPGPQAVEVEMLMNQDGIFMTMPEIGWVKMNMEGLNIQDLMKQSMTQDPATAMQQMKDLGMSVSFAEDQEKNGKKYWVINAVMGGDIFKSDYFKQLSQQMPALAPEMDLQKLFDNMDLDFVYDMWIDQNTFYTDFMNLNGKMKFKMDIPAVQESTGGSMDMAMDLKANYSISEYGKAFTTPEVKDARDFEQVLAEQAAKAQEAIK